MIDIALIREKPDWVKERLMALNDPAALERIDTVFALDQQRRAILVEAENTQAARNKLNKAAGQLRGSKGLTDERRWALAAAAAEAIAAHDYERAAALLANPGDADLPSADASAYEAMNAALGSIGEHVEAFNQQLATIEADLHETLLWIPNLPHESVPVYPSEEHNIAWPVEGALHEFDFEPKPHWELGPALGIIDFERGVRLHGTRGYILAGMGARLQRALISFYLDQARAKGYTEVYVPYMVKEEMMVGAGQFPKFRDTVYTDPDAELVMIPTAEVAITNLHRDEILEESQLPLYYVGHTPCFRKEKTSAGRDVRGIKRVHQFEKVEMYKFTTPETSYAELETLTEDACDLLRKLGLTFRRLEIVTGDLGFSASKKYDVEVWSPGCAEWLEVSSCSNTEDFQARRANIKYRPAEGKRARFVHTLNGSGLPTARVLIAILENYQQVDGSVVIPEVLRPYMAGESVIPAR
ncbi:MAG TPA: serine--tRNA ligase [Candidatus Limnocylindrales bacterium]|nr:serine--tRNA ligase [Candidatus Limnocylindrales bacterium]